MELPPDTGSASLLIGESGSGLGDVSGLDLLESGDRERGESSPLHWMTGREGGPGGSLASSESILKDLELCMALSYSRVPWRTAEFLGV